jgi:hypothetical protein
MKMIESPVGQAFQPAMIGFSGQGMLESMPHKSCLPRITE